jgi:hypothetical protein
MIEFLWGVFVAVARTVIFVLDIIVTISDLYHFGRWTTRRDKIVDVPAEPKIISPAARRALDEAEQRRLQAASGTVQAS